MLAKCEREIMVLEEETALYAVKNVLVPAFPF